MRTCASLCRSRSRGFFSFLGALLSRSVRFRFSTRGFGFCARPKTREEASPDLRAHPSVSAMVESTSATKVQLHLYDLSQGMARVMSAQLLGKQIEGGHFPYLAPVEYHPSVRPFHRVGVGGLFDSHVAGLGKSRCRSSHTRLRFHLTPEHADVRVVVS